MAMNMASSSIGAEIAIFPGEAVTGSKTGLEPLYGKLVRANALEGDFRQVAAWFHTHPGRESYVHNADSDDQ